MVQPVQQTLVYELVEEVHFLGSSLQNVGDDVFDHILRQAHVVVQIRKGDLRLDHPELGGVAGGVGVLRPEGGAKGVDVAEGHGEGLAVELAGDGQIGGLAVEVLGVIHLAVLGFGHVVQVQGGDLEHLAGALAVRAGDQGRMDIDKVPVLEELVDSHGSQTPDAEHGLEGVGPGPQVSDGPQELHGVPLGLQGIVAGGGAFHGDGAGLNLKRLLGVGGQHQRTLDDQGRADIDLGDLLEIGHGVVVYNLNGGEVGAVIEGDEAKLLASPAVADPAAYLDFRTGIFFGVLEQFTNGDQIHSGFLSSC